MALPMGQPLGNCRIVRLIGEGGFGEVCLAKNLLIERRAADNAMPRLYLSHGKMALVPTRLYSSRQHP